MTQTPSVETPSGVYAAALVSLAAHISDHDLPFPADIYIATDLSGRRMLRVQVSGVGQQMRWINTVTIATQHQEPAGPGRLRMAWRVNLPDGTGFELVGHRAGDHPPLLEVVADVASTPACTEDVNA